MEYILLDSHEFQKHNMNINYGKQSDKRKMKKIEEGRYTKSKSLKKNK